MAEHTPAPWMTIETTRTKYDEERDFAIFVDIDGYKHIIAECFFRTGRTNTVNSKANAHLIAASPDLLRELKAAREFMVRALADLVDVPGFDPTMHARIEAIDAAISKAEQGGQ